MERAEKLTEWVKRQHDGQIIRRTHEPYFNHVLRVAEIASPARFGYETGLCHDLFEKSDTNKTKLTEALNSFGYSHEDAQFIVSRVTELTDFFTAEAFPGLDKATRKQKEAERLLTISADAQTVKYGDLYDNIEWMMLHDRKKAAPYLERKKQLVSGMTKGDPAVRLKLSERIESCLAELYK